MAEKFREQFLQGKIPAKCGIDRQEFLESLNRAIQKPVTAPKPMNLKSIARQDAAVSNDEDDPEIQTMKTVNRVKPSVRPAPQVPINALPQAQTSSPHHTPVLNRQQPLVQIHKQAPPQATNSASLQGRTLVRNNSVETRPNQPVQKTKLVRHSSSAFEEYKYYYDEINEPMIDWFCGLFTKKSRESIYKPDENFYVALFDYERRSNSDLSFRKGDLLIKVQDQKGVPNDWICMILLQGRHQGFVPKPFVAKTGTIEAQDWFFGKLNHTQAEEELMNRKNAVGAFLVRFSEKDPQSFTLSVKLFKPTEDKSAYETYVKHYRVKKDPETREVSIKSDNSFRKIEDLVEFYQKNNIIETPYLSCKLKIPCQRLPPSIDLSSKYVDNWEIDRSEIKLKGKIGAGQFGKVYSGLWNKQVTVAVKEMKTNSMQIEEFLKEAATMKTFRHGNLVKLYGVCTKEKPIFIITEFMKNGSLLDYLRKNKNSKSLDTETLHYFSAQICNGMSYLEENNLVHRDLAARNVLVGLNNIAKVADFGLATQVKPGTSMQEKLKLCPVRWMAPESLIDGNFSTKSDVFSFGVVLMEIYTFGEKPWEGYKNPEVLTMIRNNQRMVKPKVVSDEVYAVAMGCWEHNPIKRPTFQALKDIFDEFKVRMQHFYYD